MYAKDWEYYGSKRGEPASDSDDSDETEREEGEPRPERKPECEEEFRKEYEHRISMGSTPERARLAALDDMEQLRDCRGYEPQGEPSEEEEPRPERKEECEQAFLGDYEIYINNGETPESARQLAIADMEFIPACKGYEPQGEPSEEEDEEIEVVNDDIDCAALLDDPEIKKLLKNIEASQTIKKQLADTLRNLSLTIDISTISIATALGAVSTPTGPGAPVGWFSAAGIAKMGGFASAGSLIAASALGFLNGDYKIAAIDGGAAVLSALLAGGGAAAKAAKPAGRTVKSVLTKLLQRGAGKLAQLEAKIAAELVAKGASKQFAKTIAKGLMTSVANTASGKLRQIIGNIPEQKEGESDQAYKQRLQRWQQEQGKKVAKIFDKCYKKTEDTQTTKNIKKAIKGFDKVVNFLGHKVEELIGYGFKLIKGAPLNESQLRVAEELGLNDAQNLNEEKLVTLHINFAELRKQELNESFLAMFGGWVESILKSMFGKTKLQLAVTGSDREVRSFANAISGEKSYMDAVRRYGLDHPTTYKNKAKLDNSIKGFERETGLKWPFK